jgi:hypothetical protein
MMKDRLYLVAVSALVLALGSLSVLVLPARGGGSWTAMADTPAWGQALSYAGDDYVYALKGRSSPEVWQVRPEHAVDVRLAALPFTEYVYQQIDVGAGASGAAVATCPAQSVVVGGGYAADSDVTFYTQYKYGNGWRGDATNFSGSSERITVFAVCLHNVIGASVTQTHGQVDVPPGAKGQAIATCPAGSIATAGGFHAYPDGRLRVYNSSKADGGEGWQSWAKNLSASTLTHHAYAVCLSGIGGSTERILESATIPPGTTGYAIATCDSGSLVSGGGFAVQDDLLVYSSSGPYSGDEWRVYVKNTSLSVDHVLFGYAICLSLPGYEVYDVYLPLVVKDHQ